MNAKDVLELSLEKDPHFWFDKFYKYFDRKKGNKSRDALNISHFIVQLALKYAVDEVFNGEELCFFDKDKKPYMILCIKDFKNSPLKAIMKVVSTHKYNYKAKFRGHFYFLYAYVYPWFREKAHIKRLEVYAKYFTYLRLSKLVKRGGEFPQMPHVKVYDGMRAPFFDCHE